MIFFKKLWCKIFRHKFIGGATSFRKVTVVEDDYIYHECLRCGFIRKSLHPNKCEAFMLRDTGRLTRKMAEALSRKTPWIEAFQKDEK